MRSAWGCAALGAVGLVVACQGCAAIVGLDQTYIVDAGAEPAEAGDADGASADSAPPSTDGAPEQDATPDTGPPAPPTVYWVTDITFGTNGYVQLAPDDKVGAANTLPVVIRDDSADGGPLLAAYEAASDKAAWLCSTIANTPSCNATSSTGVPVDLLHDAVGDVAIVVQATDTGITVMSVLGMGFNYASYFMSSACTALRGLSMSPTGTVDVLASCNGSFETLEFAPSMGSTFANTYASATFPSLPGATLAAAAAGLMDDVWFAGSVGTNGVYSHALSDGGMLSGAQLNAMQTQTYATDVAPLVDGGAILVGFYEGTAAGIFTARVDTDGDGGMLPAPHSFPLDAAVSPEPASHTRVAQVDANLHVVVGAVGARLALATVDDEGNAVPGSSPSGQLLAIDGDISMTSVSVGGAVGSGDATHVYVAFAAGGGTSMVLTRLTLIGR
jgi:hypothetical protein